MKRLLPLLALVVALALVSSGCGVVDENAAVVNGEAITVDELNDELEAIRANEEYLRALQQPANPTQAPLQVTGASEDTFSSEFVARVLSRQIVLELVHQAFEERDLELTDAELAAAEREVVQGLGGEAIFADFPRGYRETIVRRNAEVTKLQQDIAGVRVTEEVVREFYEENREEFALTCSSHILVETREEAERVRQQLEQGASFEELAAEFSTDPGSARQGGSLDCQPRGVFVPAFEEALAGLDEGEISQPVETTFGFHIIRLDERRVQPFEEVEADIRNQLLADTQGDFAQFITEAAQEAEISVNERYGRFDIEAGPTGAVIPPTAPTTSRVPAESPVDDEG